MPYVKVPDDADLAKVAPLLCAGITTYDPLVRFGCAPDSWQFSSATGRKRVGVAGIGGLGHVAVKIARSFGCEVTAISTSPDKEAAVRAIGADHFVLATDVEDMRKRGRAAAEASGADAAAAVFGGAQKPKEIPEVSGPRGTASRSCFFLILLFFFNPFVSPIPLNVMLCHCCWKFQVNNR